MKKLFTILSFLSFSSGFSQGWTICPAPPFSGRVDDIYMLNPSTGYAVGSDGRIAKTTDGNNWNLLLRDSTIYCRSVEFVNERKGFVGGFGRAGASANILRKTTDGGATWTDITHLIAPQARAICGLAAPDSNTIYACGNWYSDSAYLIKSTDGGESWSYKNMGTYASSLIDMHFTTPSIGFATGKDPQGRAIVLYTTDGGQIWSERYRNNSPGDNGYVWKLQRLSNNIYYGAIESLTNKSPKMIRSTNGGLTWEEIAVDSNIVYGVEGIGFIDAQTGWMGGGSYSYQTNNAGASWEKVNVCPGMNRAFRINDTLMYATGEKIWKYTKENITPNPPVDTSTSHVVFLHAYPNPVVNNKMRIDVNLTIATRVLIALYDAAGRRVALLLNRDMNPGQHQYDLNTSRYPKGSYVLLLKTHEDKIVQQVIVP